MSAGALSPRVLAPDDAGYPPRLRTRLGAQAPARLALRGDAALLELQLLALFCSVRVPADLVLPALDLTRAIRAAALPVIGGFQAPLERECLEFLLRGMQPVVLCPARAIDRMRLGAAWQAALAERRLLVLSGSPGHRRRPSHSLAAARNRLVAALAARVFVVHAEPGGRVQRLVTEALSWGTPVSCFAHPANHDLVLSGATPVDPAHPLG